MQFMLITTLATDLTLWEASKEQGIFPTHIFSLKRAVINVFLSADKNSNRKMQLLTFMVQDTVTDLQIRKKNCIICLHVP